MKILFTPTARRQFLNAISYIRMDKPGSAMNFRHRAEKALRRLEKLPESGRIIPEFAHLPYRELIFNPYRFFYKIENHIIWVIAVWHSAQLPGNPNANNDIDNPG